VTLCPNPSQTSIRCCCFSSVKWESVRDLQSLCGRYDLKTIFETRRRNFTCQLYDSSNSLIRVCYVVHVAFISGAFLFVLSVCLCPICCTLYCSCCSRLRINIFIHSFIHSVHQCRSLPYRRLAVSFLKKNVKSDLTKWTWMSSKILILIVSYVCRVHFLPETSRMTDSGLGVRSTLRTYGYVSMSSILKKVCSCDK